MSDVLYDKSTIAPAPPLPEGHFVFVLDAKGETILNFAAPVATCVGSVLGAGLPAGRVALITLSDGALDALARIALARKGF